MLPSLMNSTLYSNSSFNKRTKGISQLIHKESTLCWKQHSITRFLTNLKKQPKVKLKKLLALIDRKKPNVNKGHNEDRQQRKIDKVTGDVKNLKTVPSLSDDTLSDHPSLEQPQSFFINPPGKLVAVEKGIKWVTEASAKVADKTAIDNGPLGQCIVLLEGQTFAQDHMKDSRSSLTKLFNSFEGQQLFTAGSHWQAPGGTPKYKDMLKKLNNGNVTFECNANDPDYDNTLKIDANQVPVDRDSTLRFIKLFIKAVAKESKEAGQETPAQLNKKQERLQALEDIRKFVTKLDPDAPDAAALCRLALQLCGRCRERSLVRQQSLRLCGGFAALQAAWGKAPLKMTRLALKLACDYQAGSELTEVHFKLPENTNYSQYDSALADSLLLSAFYNLNFCGTVYNENMLFLSALGIAVQLFDDKQKSSDSEFIKALVQAASSKAAVSMAVDNKLSAFFYNIWLENWSRKWNKEPWNIDEDFKSFKGPDINTHALIMDSFRIVDNENIEIKIQSWGRVMRLEMKIQTFLDHTIKESTSIIHTGNKDLDSGGVFKKPADRQIYYDTARERLTFINTCNGKKIVFNDAKDTWGCYSDPKTIYQNKQGEFVFFDTDSGSKIICGSSDKNIIFKNKMGSLININTSNRKLDLWRGYGGNWYEHFDPELIYLNKKGNLVAFGANSMSKREASKIYDQKFIFQNSEGALVFINGRNKKTTIIGDFEDEWLRYYDPVIIFKNKKGEFIAFNTDCNKEIAHNKSGEIITFHTKEGELMCFNTSNCKLYEFDCYRGC